MRKGLMCLFFFLTQGLFSSVPPLFAQNYIVSLENGTIDWSNGIVEAGGIGIPPENSINMAQARAIAEKAAVTAARQNLGEIVKAVRLDSKSLIKDLALKNDKVSAEIQGFLQNSQKVHLYPGTDGSVRATVALRLTGALSDLVLPKSIKAIHPVRQPEPLSQEKRKVYTGLVIDCRGIRMEPAIAPRILDEDGHEVYGPTYASREYAVEQGMSGYAKDLTTAQANQRVADSPLTVKGIRMAESGPSDVIITNADAERIRRVASSLSFLQKCRVVVVLD